MHIFNVSGGGCRRFVRGWRARMVHGGGRRSGTIWGGQRSRTEGSVLRELCTAVESIAVGVARFHWGCWAARTFIRVPPLTVSRMYSDNFWNATCTVLATLPRSSGSKPSKRFGLKVRREQRVRQQVWAGNQLLRQGNEGWWVAHLQPPGG